MNIRKTLLSGILASSMALGGAAALAQDSTPMADEGDMGATPVADITTLEGVPFIDADGNVVAHADIWEDEEDGGVWFSITNDGEAMLGEGKYGVHVHETGVCDETTDPPFSSAGDHFNPTNEEHGDINADPSHAGDLGNLEVDEDGNFEHEVLAEKLTMSTGSDNSLADEDGTALMIHSGEDDLETDPSGESGDRWACAIIFAAPEEQGTPVATPEMDEATPEVDTDVVPEEEDGALEDGDVVVTDDEDMPQDDEDDSGN